MDLTAIRDYCLSLPFTTEVIKWDDALCFLIAGKMYCVCHAGHPFTCAFKVPDEDYEELSTSEDIIPAPYMARVKWVQVRNEGRFSPIEWQQLLQQSYTLVKAKLPKKLRDTLV